ncbi:MAG: transglutaminase-like domain-containing protein [Halobacteriota archaeon]
MTRVNEAIENEGLSNAGSVYPGDSNDHVSEITERAHTSKELPKTPRLGTGRTFGRMLLESPAALRKFRVIGPNEERYVRPPREYEIPPFRKSMKWCTSKEKYLRPTRWCNPSEPEIVAMANELGAYKLSDYEFADAAFWFVKTKLVAEMLSMNSVSATLKRGSGTCYHLISVWIALCRAAGIKARYKTFNMLLPDEIMDQAMTAGEAMTGDMFNRGLPEGEGEVCIDGNWVVGHVAMRPEIYARTGLPIPKFGEDAIGLTFKLIPGTVKRFESIPLWLGTGMNAIMWLAPAAMERANLTISNTVIMGRKIIEEAGGCEAYDKKARERMVHTPIIEAKEQAALVFED